MLTDIGLTGVKQFCHANLRQPECLVHKYNVYKFFSVFIAVKENFSLIDEKGIGEYRLAPAYDLLSVLLADKNDTDEMAMTFEVGGRKSGFGRETFIKAMTESGAIPNSLPISF